MHKLKEQKLAMLIEHSRIIYSVVSDMSVFYSAWAEDFEKSNDT
jgi:hypothetical protein